jgi:hypothetical protein
VAQLATAPFQETAATSGTVAEPKAKAFCKQNAVNDKDHSVDKSVNLYTVLDKPYFK